MKHNFLNGKVSFMNSYLFIMGIFLPACSYASSIAEYQASCEKVFKEFPAMTSCLSEKIKSDSSYSSDPDARLYVAQANSLAGRVKRNEMHEKDAALELQEKYNFMNDRYRKSLQPKDNSFISSVKERLRHQRSPQQQQNIIITPNVKKDCTTDGGPINYNCIYGN